MDNVEDATRHGESRRQGKAFRPRVGVDVAAHGGLLRSEPSGREHCHAVAGRSALALCARRHEATDVIWTQGPEL